MNIPFPIIYPPLFCSDWFNPDRPYDEDAELTRMEEANERWLNSIALKYMKHPPKPKPNPEPMEEAEADDDATDPEESEGSHDADDLDEIPTTTTTSSGSPPTIFDDGEPLSLSDSPAEDSPEEISVGEVSAEEESLEPVSPANTDDLEIESLWPFVVEDD